MQNFLFAGRLSAPILPLHPVQCLRPEEGSPLLLQQFLYRILQPKILHTLYFVHGLGQHICFVPPDIVSEPGLSTGIVLWDFHIFPSDKYWPVSTRLSLLLQCLPSNPHYIMCWVFSWCSVFHVFSNFAHV
jgi:hypothetical protein